jgi:hypothetical protein
MTNDPFGWNIYFMRKFTRVGWPVYKSSLELSHPSKITSTNIHSNQDIIRSGVRNAAQNVKIMDIFPWPVEEMESVRAEI